MSETEENKSFYIIGINRNEEGLFAIVSSVISHSLYAKSLNLIPVVDMKNFKNQYFKEGRESQDNVWEYFFEQPGGYKLSDIPKNSTTYYSKNVLYPTTRFSLYNDDIPISDQNKISEYKKFLKSEYKRILKFTPEINEYLASESGKLIGDGENTLGVLCRGTDYLLKKPKNEAIVPSPKRVIKKVKSLLKTNRNIKKIYLATEDAGIYDLFKKEFGDLIIDNSQYRYGKEYDKSKYLYEIDIDKKDHKYNLAKQYLLSVYILSKCKYFVGSRTTGTKWAWILSDGWKKSYIWKLGRYGCPWAFLHNIFSVKNLYDFDTKIKVITILGVKIVVGKKSETSNTAKILNTLEKK